jgi:hypothetical protein
MPITSKQEATVHMQIAIPMQNVTTAYMLSCVGLKVDKTLQFINACQSPV